MPSQPRVLCLAFLLVLSRSSLLFGRGQPVWPFLDRPTLIENDETFRKYHFKLEEQTAETRRRIRARDIPQPDPDVFAGMPKLFQDMAKAEPRLAWNPDIFYRGKKNVMYGSSHEAALELERHVLGTSPYSINRSTPAWVVNALQSFEDFIHGGPFNTHPALRSQIVRKLGGPSVLPEDEVAKEFLRKYTRGQNIPPIEFGEASYALSQIDPEVPGHYKIRVPRRPEADSGLSAYEIIRHELDHHKQASPQLKRRAWGASDVTLSSVEFVSIADAAFTVLFHQEREIRRKLRAKEVRHPDDDRALYRRIRRDVLADPLYAQTIKFPSGYEISLGDFADFARSAGFDPSRKEIAADVTTMMAKGKALIRLMVFGSHADPAAYFSRNRHEGGTTNLSGPRRGVPPNENTLPLVLTPDAREKEMPDWRDRMSRFGYKKVGNKGDDSDWKYFPELDPRNKKK